MKPLNEIRLDVALAKADAIAKVDAQRMFPSYTTAQLKQFVAEGVTELRSAEKVEQIKREIAARESGASDVKVTPQIEGGKLHSIVGRSRQ